MLGGSQVGKQQRALSWGGGTPMFPGWELLLPNTGTTRGPGGWVLRGAPCPLLSNQPPKKQKLRIWEAQVQLTGGGEVWMGMQLCRRARGWEVFYIPPPVCWHLPLPKKLAHPAPGMVPARSGPPVRSHFAGSHHKRN